MVTRNNQKGILALKEEYERKITEAGLERFKPENTPEVDSFLTGVQAALIDVVGDLEELLK